MFGFLEIATHLASAHDAMGRASAALEGAYPDRWEGPAATAYVGQVTDAVAAANRLRTRISYVQAAVAT